MSTSPKWMLSREEQQKLVTAFTAVLAPLRATLGISQGELAYLVGLTRQTISMVESRKREMSWQTYLSLMFFFDSNVATHRMIRSLSVYPNEIIARFNGGEPIDVSEIFIASNENADEISKMLIALDEKGVHSLKTVLMLEYARCTNADTLDIMNLKNS